MTIATTTAQQQGDVQLQQTPEDGDIELTDDGLIVMSSGLDTAAYLSLFGGNDDDPGGDDASLAWWGNLLDRPGPRRQRSETQHFMAGLPATTGNLRRVETAAKRDLAWMVSEGVASRVAAVATMPAVRRLQLAVTIEADAGDIELRYVENWGAS